MQLGRNENELASRLHRRERTKGGTRMHKATLLTLLIGCVILARAPHVIAHGFSPSVAQVVALDECDPDTFNLPIDQGGLGSGGGALSDTVSLEAFGYEPS